MLMTRGIVVFLLLLTVFTSCQRELDFDYSNPSEGTLKSDLTGDCLPSSISGTFKAGSETNESNYIEVDLDVTLTGTYQIQSDTVNGYSFAGSGVVKNTGSNTVRITCTGKPVIAGIDLLTIKYNNSVCKINVPVLDSAGNALFTLSGAPGNCSGAILSGTYKQGTPLNSSNTANLTVDVVTVGPYNVSTTDVNGMTFTATGTFTQTGTQHIDLIGSGTPDAAGDFNFIASNGYSNCTYSITIDNAEPALYSLGGSPGSCTGVMLAGNYIAATALTASNTATINVDVMSPGSYSISAPAANGVVFSKAGYFASTGLQTVVLQASGTPLSIAVVNHIVSGGGTSCTFSVDYMAVPPVANYGLSGAPGHCSPSLLTGSYIVGMPMNSSNTLTLEVDVVSTGTFICSTPFVNGISFKKTGTFTSTGLQTIVLEATGTPLAAGTFMYFNQTSVFSVCWIEITAFPASTDIINCKIDGTLTNFNTLASAVSASPDQLLITGLASPGSNEKIFLKITKTSGNITAGTYTDQTPGVSLLVKYDDPALNSWEAISGSPTPFTIIISSLNSTRAIGTFSGTLKNNAGAGPGSKTITAGTFDVPVN